MANASDICNNISENLSRILRDRGWNVLRLVSEMGGAVPQNTVYMIHRGEVSGSVTALATIAEVLNVRVDDLISDPPSKEKSAKVRKRVSRAAG